MLITIEKLVKKNFVKQQQTNFITTWSSSIVRKVGDLFRYNFKASSWTHLLGYKDVNLGEIT